MAVLALIESPSIVLILFVVTTLILAWSPWMVRNSRNEKPSKTEVLQTIVVNTLSFSIVMVLSAWMVTSQGAINVTAAQVVKDNSIVSQHHAVYLAPRSGKAKVIDNMRFLNEEGEHKVLVEKKDNTIVITRL